MKIHFHLYFEIRISSVLHGATYGVISAGLCSLLHPSFLLSGFTDHACISTGPVMILWLIILVHSLSDISRFMPGDIGYHYSICFI